MEESIRLICKKNKASENADSACLRSHAQPILSVMQLFGVSNLY